jgi:hypothetical protein
MMVKGSESILLRWMRMAGGTEASANQGHQRIKHSSDWRRGLWQWPAMLASVVWIAVSGATLAAASEPAHPQMSKLALDAYCTEAKEEQRPLAEGQISYKTIVEKAGERAVEEHPDVSSNPDAWKTKIVSVLDQFGDEPMTQLCRENPAKPQS